MTKTEQPIAIICIFIWVGFVAAISFLESWLKFRAPGVTLPIGLGIGRLIFNVLNKIEWVFALVIIGSFTQNIITVTLREKGLMVLLSVILLSQTFWLLPKLDERATLVIQNKNLPDSALHFYYVACEVLKITALIVLGIKLFKQ